MSKYDFLILENVICDTGNTPSHCQLTVKQLHLVKRKWVNQSNIKDRAATVTQHCRSSAPPPAFNDFCHLMYGSD